MNNFIFDDSLNYKINKLLNSLDNLRPIYLNEEWKQIKDYPNYEVSTLGNIRNIRTNKILSSWSNRDGYLQINLGFKNTKLIHRLVSEAFIPNINKRYYIMHIDNNKKNNNVNNLKWSKYKKKDINDIKTEYFTVNDKIISYYHIHNKCFKTLNEAIEYINEINN